MPARSLRETLATQSLESTRGIRRRQDCHQRPLDRRGGLDRRHLEALRPERILQFAKCVGEHVFPVIRRRGQQVRAPRPFDELGPRPDHDTGARAPLRNQPPHSTRGTGVGDQQESQWFAHRYRHSAIYTLSRASFSIRGRNTPMNRRVSSTSQFTTSSR